MKTNKKWTVAALVALGAVTVHTLHAQATGPMSLVRAGDASTTNTDWRPLTQSFGIHFPAQRTAWDPIAGGPPSRGFSLPIFDGLEKMQVWREVR